MSIGHTGTGAAHAESAPQSQASDAAYLAVVGYIIVFCGMQSLAVLGLYLFARSGLETFKTSAFGLFGMTVAVMAASFIPMRLARGYWSPLLTALVACATLLLPVLGLSIGIWSLLPVGVAGAVGLGMAISSCRRLILAHPVTLLLGAPAFALVRFIAINGGQLTHIYAPEFMFLGQPYLDTSFHAALTEMIRNFGVVSGGLDGLVPQFHHAGSHAWLGSVSRMFAMPAIALYPMAFQILVVPCFTYFFLYAVTYTQRADLRNPVTMIVSALIVTSISSWFFLDKLLLTESYAFALTLYFAAIPLLLALLSRDETPSTGMWLCVLAASFLAVVMFTLKIPVGVMWAAAVAVILVRRFTYSRWRNTVIAMLLLAAIGTSVTLLIIDLLIYRDLWALVSPFDFAGGSQKYYLSDLAIIALIAIFIGIAGRKGAHSRADIAGGLGALAVLGALPGAIFAVENVAYYFVNVVAWLALVLLTGQVVNMLGKRVERSRLATLGAIVLLITVIVADPDRYKRLSIYLQRVATLQEFGRQGEVGEWPQKRSFSQSLTIIGNVGPTLVGTAMRLDALFPGNVAANIGKSPGALFVHQVRDALAGSSGRLIVFVPPDNTEFWMMTRDCRAQPFFIPATTGVPMLMGLHPNGLAMPCPLDVTYGFGKYGIESHSRDLEPADLCKQALARGFDEVFVLEASDGARQSRRIACSP